MFKRVRAIFYPSAMLCLVLLNTWVWSLIQSTVMADTLKHSVIQMVDDNSSQHEQMLSHVPEMMAIPAGSFHMGSLENEMGRSDDEGPVHKVNIKAFAIGKYDVTKGQFRDFVAATGYKTEAEQGAGCYSLKGSTWERSIEFNWHNLGFNQPDDHPVVCVLWNDAMAYIKWLSAQTGKHYRLPTEAEWEYAERAGTNTSRYWGDDPNEACRYANVADKTAKHYLPAWTNIHKCSDGYETTSPVGHFLPNAFGLYDMLGNVWQWTCSEYSASYNGNEQQCQPKKAANHVERGGSWFAVPEGLRFSLPRPRHRF